MTAAVMWFTAVFCKLVDLSVVVAIRIISVSVCSEYSVFVSRDAICVGMALIGTNSDLQSSILRDYYGFTLPATDIMRSCLRLFLFTALIIFE